MQSAAQLADQSGQKPERPWWQFKPGQSGNPSGINGRTKPAPRLVAEIERLTAGLGREPTVIEAVLIKQLAAVLLRPPNLETARIASRICAQLGQSALVAGHRELAADGTAAPPVAQWPADKGERTE